MANGLPAQNIATWDGGAGAPAQPGLRVGLPESEVGALPPGWYGLRVVFSDGSSAAAGFVKM